ncbi:MAG: Gfo/Idh/MocA family oxidoreductase [Methanopyri archaeon]|nr:Gfo/Idh/MocA family oxidoreductase [Methanopyri archaeon]
MADNVGTAVVGVGFVGGQAHVPAFKKIEGSNLVAICDIAEDRVKPLAKKYDVPYYLDYEKLLEDDKVEAVMLSLPTPRQYGMAMQAIKKGKHVLCEMPIAATIEQTKELGKAAEEAGVVLMPNLNFRFAPIYAKIKEMIKAGAIGKPIALHFREFIPASALAEQWPPGSWAWNLEKSGGYPDFTLSVWSLDMFRWMFDCEIESVEWKPSYPTLEKVGGITGYNTMGVIKLSNGIVGNLHYGATTNAAAAISRLEVYGDNTNVLHAINTDKVILYGSEPERQEWDLAVRGTRVWGHRQTDAHFVQSILQGKEPDITIEDAIKVQEIAMRIVGSE